MTSVVSLFSGCGGLDIGFKETGFELLYACDNDPAAVECYTRNIDHNIRLRDVTSENFRQDLGEIGSCEVLLGGFPCQGFSKAGPKDMKDDRNALYTQMCRAVEVLNPLVFVAENVDGISQNFNGLFLQKIVTDFRLLGYRVEHRVLDALAYGLPQYRRRVFFVGIRTDLLKKFNWPIPTHEALPRNGETKMMTSCVDSSQISLMGMESLAPAKTIASAITDLIQLDPSIPDHRVTGKWPNKYKHIFRSIDQGQKLCNVRHAPTSVYTWDIPEVFGDVTTRGKTILETIAKHRRHKKYGSIPNGNPLPIEEIERLSGLDDIGPDINLLLRTGYLKDCKGKYDLKGALFCSGIFKRPIWDEPSPTVLTNFHNPRYFLHPLQDRPFSLRECARLQGFPDNFVFTTDKGKAGLIDGYRLVGNAVPPPISRLLATSVLNLLITHLAFGESNYETTLV
jgi:DNA (cytosine-5)-methyltransferase 1